MLQLFVALQRATLYKQIYNTSIVLNFNGGGIRKKVSKKAPHGEEKLMGKKRFRKSDLA